MSAASERFIRGGMIPFLMESHHTPSTPGQLIEQLVRRGLDADKGLAEQIVRTPECIPLLIEVLDDDALWASDCWAPIHALHLLSAMRVKEAVPIVLRLLRTDPDVFGDWLTETLP